jgi:hypothetical protein
MANIDPALVKQVFDIAAKIAGNRTYIMTASWMISGDVLK